MGKMDTQRGQKLTLRCSACKRPLGIFYTQKNISDTPKLVILSGSVHKTKKDTYIIHTKCKCGAKTVFESLTSKISKYGWKQIKSTKPN